MAVPATAAAANTWLVDPSKPATYPVTLGNGVLRPDQDGRKSFSSVACKSTTIQCHSNTPHRPSTDNHKPSQTCTSRTTTITPTSASTSDQYELSIEDNDDPPSRYAYRGRRASSKSSTESFVLIYSPTKQAFALEQLDAELEFNITSTPWETDPDKLRQTYPQLGFDRHTVSDGDDDVTASADEANPYDYRHYLSGWGRNHNATSDSERDAASTATRDADYLEMDSDQVSRRTPCPVPRPSPTSTKPAMTKAKPKAKPKPKAPPKQPTSHPRPKQAEARADSADDESSSSEDDGGLTIELDPDTKPANKRGGFGNHGHGSKRHGHSLHPHHPANRPGPISLRSAASSMSPASVNQRTRPDAPSSDESDVDDDAAGESDDDDEGVALPVGGLKMLHQPQVQAEESSASDEDDDDDNPPPRHQIQPPRQEQAEEEDDEEEEIDLEAELAVALEGVGDEDVPMADVGVPVPMPMNKAHESESESEEE